MSALQVAFGDLAGWLALLSATIGPGLVAALLWSPFLASERVRALFRALPPSGSLLATYVPAAVAGSLPYVAGFYAALSRGTGPRSGEVVANALLDVIVPVSLAYLVGVPVFACVLLPRVGVDWDPTAYGPGTWAILAFGGAWYAAVFAVPLFFFAVIAALPMGA